MQFLIVPKGRDALHPFVLQYQTHPFQTGRWREELLWGHIDERHVQIYKSKHPRNVVKESLGAEHGRYHRDDHERRKEHASWTVACTHEKPHSGFTCGLWDLFHILTIGASLNERQSYGFRHVAQTIRQSEFPTIDNDGTDISLDELCQLALLHCTPLSLSDMYKYASANANSNNYQP